MADKVEDTVLQMKTLNVELRKKLEIVSKWRVECAELQLEFLKLYSPVTLEIVELLEQPMGMSINLNDESKSN